MSGMFTNKVSRVVEGDDNKFRHLFGGHSKYKGITPPGCATPLHLLYRFDTTDPNFPFQPPGVQILPLLYCFPYNAGACGYRVKSDSEIEVLYMETKKLEPNFPYEDYPATFPEKRVRLAPITYDENKTLVFYLEAGKEALNEEDRDLVLDKFKYPFTQLGGIHRMWQGTPEVSCPNKACEYGRWRAMEVFAVIWNEPHKGAFLWEENDDGACDIQTIFQVCPKCFSIHACNRCT